MREVDEVWRGAGHGREKEGARAPLTPPLSLLTSVTRKFMTRRFMSSLRTSTAAVRAAQSGLVMRRSSDALCGKGWR